MLLCFPALQAHELLRGALAAQQASAGPEGRPPPTVLLVHGILGNRRNMQGFARRLLAVSMATSRRNLHSLTCPFDFNAGTRSPLHCHTR